MSGGKRDLYTWKVLMIKIISLLLVGDLVEIDQIHILNQDIGDSRQQA